MAATERTTVVEEREVRVQRVFPPEFIFIRRFLYYLLDVFEALLGIRFLLKAFGASTASGFVRFIYGITSPLIAPFRGIFPPYEDGGLMIEWASLVAIAVYALLTYAILRLIRLIYTRPR
jgi:uncharacterized protein YggT (Ycf19 family)